MTIRFTQGGPDATIDKLAGWVPELDRAAAGGGAPWTLSDAYEVCHLALDAIGDGALFDATHRSSWRHLVQAGGSVQGELELDDDHAPIAIHEGPAKDGFGKALQIAQELPGDHEVSVLMSPPLHFVALAARGDAGDMIIPYEPNGTDLRNYQAYTAEQVLELLQPMAREVLEAAAGDELTGG